MARRAKADAPPPHDATADDVFGSAAPPPPQAIAKRVPKAPQGSPGAPPSAAPATPLDGAAAGPSSAAGPWCTFGLGGNLLAKNAALFWVLTGLTYAVGLGVLYYLVGSGWRRSRPCRRWAGPAGAG